MECIGNRPKKLMQAIALIQMISNGCALLENWDNAASNGKSINYIDPTNNKWKQAWVGSNTAGTQEFEPRI